jgi:apolipoprotein N-acyltransferase
LRRDALAALSGLLLVLSFPKFGHGALAWLALLPLLSALPGTSGRRAFRLGYVTGAVSGLGLLYWTALVVRQFGGLSLPVSTAVMTLLCLAVALFPSIFGWLVALWVRRYGRPALLLAPLAWVATEILRAHTLMRFSWCLLGYSQAESAPFIQVAAFTAVYGVSCLVAFPAAALAYALGDPGRRARLAALAAAAGVPALAFGYGVWRMGTPLSAADSIRVALVQANIRQDEKWDQSKLVANFTRHVSLTRQAAAAGARLVVWPESAVAWRYDSDAFVAASLRALAQETRAYLVVGNDDAAGPPGRERFFVGAKLIDPQGRLTLRYHKVRLVPFGEYVPLQPLLTLGGRVAARLVQQVSDFTPGDAALVGEADTRRLGVSICYEAIFPDYERLFVNAGADLLVNITNDAWYGMSSAPYQHFAMARFRAVENGVYLVRAANTGISGIVDPFGRVLERTPLFETAVLVRDVPKAKLETFYARRGDLFAWSCFAAAAALTAAALRPSGHAG